MPILLLNQPFVSVGLGSFTLTIPSSGGYHVLVQSTEIPPSALSITITKNASNVYTSPVLSPTQGAIQLKASLGECSTNDAIVVTLSSSQSNPTDNDNLLNSLKTTIALNNGL